MTCQARLFGGAGPVMVRRVGLIRNIAAALVALILCAAPAAQAREMALTFDDLPYAGWPFSEDLAGGERVTGAILATLAQYQAPAIGFVNEGRLDVPDEREARIALLRRWADAGAPLANHTYSHADLNALTIDQFEGEIVRGETAIKALTPPHATRYFRYPFNHLGNTAEKLAAIDSFLAQRGYVVAPHTIDSEDFIFNAVYREALEKNDEAAAAKTQAAYIDFVIGAAAFAETIAPRVVGHDIPQVILLHANDLNADTLGALLDRLGKRGYHFVTLDAAMRDPAYATPYSFVTANGPTWLWRWRKVLKRDVSFAADPEPPACSPRPGRFSP